MLAIVLLTDAPVIVAAGDALTDEQVEARVALRLGYAPRRTTA